VTEAEIAATHPPIAPWLVASPAGWRVTLLVRGAPRMVYLRCEPDNEELLIAMQQVGEAGGVAHYEVELPWDRANPATHYAFKRIGERRPDLAGRRR